jgi:hypothetical protein
MAASARRSAATSPRPHLRHILNDAIYPASIQAVRIAARVALTVLVAQAVLARLDQLQRLVHVRVQHHRRKAQACERLREPQHAEERARGRVRVCAVVLGVCIGLFAEADVGVDDVG